MPTDYLNSQNVASIAAEFWGTMPILTLSMVRSFPCPIIPQDAISGKIEIHGAWNGEVELRVSRNLADRTAECLLEKDPQEVTTEERLDVIQEATNIVAGGIKRLLPAICKMSIPSTAVCRSLIPDSMAPASILTLLSSSSGELSIVVVPYR
jgi:CheY-specific phosphatase CheX